MSDEVLLFPQTWDSYFFNLSEPKKLPFIKIHYLKLPFFNEENLQANQYLQPVYLKLPWEKESLKKEFLALCEWALNFRTPEVLKYYFSFKENVENFLEENFFYIPLNPSKKEDFQTEKNALFLLGLAEKLDREIDEIIKSLKKIEKKYNEIFDEKIIGEDITFTKLEDINFWQEPFFLYFKDLFSLEKRLWAWKVLLSYINLPKISSLLITQEAVIEKISEKFLINLMEENEKYKVYEVYAGLSEIISLEKTEKEDKKVEVTRVYLYKTD